MKAVTFRLDEDAVLGLKEAHKLFQLQLGMEVSFNAFVNKAVKHLPYHFDGYKIPNYPLGPEYYNEEGEVTLDNLPF